MGKRSIATLERSNMMQHILPLLILFGAMLSNMPLRSQVIPIPQAHAHNDYEHERPLLDALDQGFTSVEADVHLIDGVLRVVHDPPEDPEAVPTLTEAYLKPLSDRVEVQGGRVYAQFSGPFFLMIDIKTEAESTYALIKEALIPFRDMLSVEENGEYRPGVVTVFLSGNRPMKALLADPLKFAFLDGRPADLGKGYPAEIMPVISDHYRRHLSWGGEGPVPEKEKAVLAELAEKVHGESKKLRLWASPENEAVWGFLLDNGADLINTDQLKGLRAFISSREENE